jgi:cytoskeletal protein CcmA (bactofilin family)
MFKRSVCLAILSYVLLMPLAPAPAIAQERQLQLGRDVFAAGGGITLQNQVAGDALLAGGQVNLNAPVGGDAALAGGEVTVSGSVGQDLYAAGGQLRINGMVAGSARLAGGDIRLAQGGRVADGVSAAGGRIALDGTVGGYANIAGGSMSIDGTVNGDVEAAGGSLRIGPNAVIQGQLTYRGPRAADVAAGAQVRDGVNNIAYEPPMSRRGLPFLLGMVALLWLVGWAIVGALLLWLFPAQTRGATLAAQANPGFAALIGLIALVVIPVIIVLLMLSGIGIPLALLAALLYFVLLPLDFLSGIIAIGDWFLPRLTRQPGEVTAGHRIVAFILALIAVAILTQIPFIGWLGGLLLWIIGIGALLLALTQRGPAPEPMANS